MVKKKEENEIGLTKPMEEESSILARTNKIIPGTEEETPEDIPMPRLRLLQSVSTEVEEGGSQAGFIRHSLSGEEFEKLEIIPLCLRKIRVHFDPENIKGAPLCFAPEAKMSRSGHKCLENCPHDGAYLTKNNEPPKCDLMKSFPCLLVKDGKVTGDFAAATFAKSSIPAAAKIIYLRIQSAQPYWHYVYELSSRRKKFSKGTAYIFDTRQIRKTTKEERSLASSIYNSIRGVEAKEEEVISEDRFE